MSVDPLSLLRAQARRPATPTDGREALPGGVIPGSLPGQPGYASKIPPPDGPAIGEVPDAPIAYSVDGQAAPLPYPTYGQPQAGPISLARRVMIYCGRGEDYVVSVEESAEDEALYSKRYSLSELMPILEVVRALGAKVVDRTGGELQANAIAFRSHQEQGPSRAPTRGEGSQGQPPDWAQVPFPESTNGPG